MSQFLGSKMLPVDGVQDARPSGVIGDWVPAGGPQEDRCKVTSKRMVVSI